MFPTRCTENVPWNVLRVHVCPSGTPKTLWCVPAWTVMPLNTAPQLCAVEALTTPFAIQKLLYCCAGAFNCQSPGACEWSICTDALSHSMQFYQTKCATAIQDRWQVQNLWMQDFFSVYVHTRKTRETGGYLSPRQTREDKKPYFLSYFLL